MPKIIALKILFISVFVFQTLGLNAQIGLAVAKNDNGSTVKYALETGKDINEALNKAVKMLEDEGAKNVFKLKSTENTGHELNEGFYVIIFSSRKGGGRFFLSYGLGASKISKEDAIKKAVVHLKEFDWGYENSFGYKIAKEGKVEDLFIAKED
ncbi:MAG: hypothetical protein ABFS35_06420 [Bacteroidota bacterium]